MSRINTSFNLTSKWRILGIYEMDAVRIYLVGGSKLFRHGLRSDLGGDGLSVVGEIDDYLDLAAAH